jgi:hypothetical protein
MQTARQHQPERGLVDALASLMHRAILHTEHPGRTEAMPLRGKRDRSLGYPAAKGLAVSAARRGRRRSHVRIVSDPPAFSTAQLQFQRPGERRSNQIATALQQ